MKTADLEFPVPRSRERYEDKKRLYSIAAQMTLDGWLIDRDRARAHQIEATEMHGHYLACFEELSGRKDLQKAAQTEAVRSYFWDVLKVPVVSKHKRTKKRKLDSPALITYAHDSHDEHTRKCAAALYALRKNWKKMEYMAAYLELSAEDGRVHPRWNPGGTKTGRWGCGDPNVQQVSSRTPKFDFKDGQGEVPLVKGYKDVFVADAGFVLLDADYAALELYLQTYIAGEPKLIDYIAQGLDLHIINARVMLGSRIVPPEATRLSHKSAREVGKLAYGFAYNASEDVTQVAKQMRQKMPHITEELAGRMRTNYFSEYPAFPRWQRATQKQITDHGYISTPLKGRRLYLAANSRGFNQGLNGQAQITGADRANLALLDLFPKLRRDWGEQVRGQIHDSLVTQCRLEEAERVGGLLVYAMTYPMEIYGVMAKFVAEPGIGRNWADMVDLGKYLKGEASFE